MSVKTVRRQTPAVLQHPGAGGKNSSKQSRPYLVLKKSLSLCLKHGTSEQIPGVEKVARCHLVE